MTLDQATKIFEAYFTKIAFAEKNQFDKGLPVCWSGGIRTFDETSWALYAAKDAAIVEWLDAAKSVAEGPNLKWIARPELLEFQITIADKNGSHRVVNSRYAVKSQFTTGTE